MEGQRDRSRWLSSPLALDVLPSLLRLLACRRQSGPACASPDLVGRGLRRKGGKGEGVDVEPLQGGVEVATKAADEGGAGDYRLAPGSRPIQTARRMGGHLQLVQRARDRDP